MTKKTIPIITPYLWKWAKEDAIYLAEAYRRLSGLDLGVVLNLKDVSDALHRLELRNVLLKTDVVHREKRVMSPKERYVAAGDKVEVSQRWIPFTLYYHPDLAVEKLNEKRRKLELLSMIGEWSARIAEECLYDVCKDVFGYWDEKGKRRINVVRSAFESPDGDVVVHSVEKVFEITVRFENPVSMLYVGAKRKWRNKHKIDYDLIILACDTTEDVWRTHRYPLSPHTDYVRVHKLGFTFPVFFDFWWSLPLFESVYREVVKITRGRFKMRLSEIIGRYA